MFRTDLPFTRSQGLAAGLTSIELRRSTYRRIFKGVYVDALVPISPIQRTRAALLCVGPTAFASHQSAARLYGVPIPADPNEHVSVLEVAARKPRTGVRCHVNRCPELRRIHDLPVSAPGQLFLELATELTLVDLVVAGDWLLRRRLVTREELQHRSAGASGRGVPLARRASRLIRDDVDSPQESRLRLLLQLAGAPEPVVNLTIRDVDGEPVRRYDLAWPDVRVAVEYDGRQHIERVEAWESDILRRDDSENDGWRVLTVTSSGIHRHPEQTIARVWRVLGARGLRSLPSRPGDGWRPHFGR